MIQIDNNNSKFHISFAWEGMVDVDFSALLLNREGLLDKASDFVFYNSECRTKPFIREQHRTLSHWRASTTPMTEDGSVIMIEEDAPFLDCCSESFLVNTHLISPDISEILFVASIYDKRYALGLGGMENPFLALSRPTDNEVFHRYYYAGNYAKQHSMLAAKLIRDDNSQWKLVEDGRGYPDGIEYWANYYYTESTKPYNKENQR